MTESDVQAMVERELSEYRYDPPVGTLGKPWSPERVAAELRKLEAALLPPVSVTLHVLDSGPRPGWLIAHAAHRLVVFFDPLEHNFGLGERASTGGVTDICVRGDLVDTFMAA